MARRRLRSQKTDDGTRGRLVYESKDAYSVRRPHHRPARVGHIPLVCVWIARQCLPRRVSRRHCHHGRRVSALGSDWRWRGRHTRRGHRQRQAETGRRIHRRIMAPVRHGIYMAFYMAFIHAILSSMTLGVVRLPARPAASPPTVLPGEAHSRQSHAPATSALDKLRLLDWFFSLYMYCPRLYTRLVPTQTHNHMDCCWLCCVAAL